MSETLFDIICGIGSSPATEVASLSGWARGNKGVAGARRVLLIDLAYTREQGIGERVRADLCEVLSLDVNHNQERSASTGAERNHRGLQR